MAQAEWHTASPSGTRKYTSTWDSSERLIMASVAAELPQGAVARCRVGGLGELLDGQDGGRGHEEDEADVERQVGDHEAQAGRLGEHFVGRENARDRPQEARVGVVGASGCPSRSRPGRGAAGPPRCRPRAASFSPAVLPLSAYITFRYCGVGNAAGGLQGLHGLIGSDDDHGRGRHGVVLQLRVVQGTCQRVLLAGDGHRGGGLQHGAGQGRPPCPCCSPSAQVPACQGPRAPGPAARGRR